MATKSVAALGRLRMVGMALFLGGVLVIIAALSMNDYRIDDKGLERAVGNGEHRAAITQALGDSKGRTYTSLLEFLDEVEAAITVANKQGSAGISSYDQGQYLMYITKHAGVGFLENNRILVLIFSIVLACVGALIYIVPQAAQTPPGIRNDRLFTSAATSRGWIGIVVGSLLIGFYIVLYWAPQFVAPWIRLVDPISYALSGNQAGQWFLYGFLYTVSMLVMGVRMFIRYRHNRYQLIRTGSVLFFQTAFAFIIPEILVALNQPYFDFKFMWPLDYDFFYNWHLDKLSSSGALGMFMLVWGLALLLVAVPLFTWLWGKRWYCSWVCGCGGLAETVGDPYRHLSDKSLKAWRVERILIHSVLVFAVVMTSVTLINYFSDYQLLGEATGTFQRAYGFLIGSAFAGVVGTGFYPFMGNRVWCRFGCPLAAILGIVQRFQSRFRITTNGGQCMSCGNCSTYCEMGIDVRSYAQRGQDIVRASCVGCGICSAVCPRGVLKLENGPASTRNLEINTVLHGGVKQIQIVEPD